MEEKLILGKKDQSTTTAKYLKIIDLEEENLQLAWHREKETPRNQ